MKKNNIIKLKKIKGLQNISLPISDADYWQIQFEGTINDLDSWQSTNRIRAIIEENKIELKLVVDKEEVLDKSGSIKLTKELIEILDKMIAENRLN